LAEKCFVCQKDDAVSSIYLKEIRIGKFTDTRSFMACESCADIIQQDFQRSVELLRTDAEQELRKGELI
jgi:hypothetical protein